MAAQPGRRRAKAAAGPRRPSVAELAGAEQKRLRDVIGSGLSVLFCGINPGLYSAATGHHFARPGNRFWPSMFAAGFTPRLLDPFEDATLLELGLGITNLVGRTTASADLLAREELTAGAKNLERKLRAHRPRILAMVGLGAYRVAFQTPKATCGLQPRMVGETQVWLLPNPSGLNAHHQVADLALLFGELRRHAARLPPLARPVNKRSGPKRGSDADS